MSGLEEKLGLSQVEAVPVKVNGIELDLEQKRQLIQLLLACPAVKDVNKRALLAERLLAESSLLKGNEQKTDISLVLHILNYCAQRFDTIDQLVYEIRIVERIADKDSDESRALNVFLRNLFQATDREFNTTIPYSHLRELHSLLAEIHWPRPVWVNAYTASMPDGADAVDDMYATEKSEIPFLLLNDLAVTRPHKEEIKIAPIVEFVERLVRHAQSDIQSLIATQKEQGILDALREWSRKRANEAGMRLQLEWLRNHLSFYELPVVTHLLIALYPLDAKNEFFRVWAWFVNNESIIPEKVQPYTKERIKLKEIAQYIGEIQKRYDQYNLSEDFAVEIFLPTKLLWYAVENYKTIPNELEDVKVKVKLGIQHNVVVRSLKRATNRRMHKRWKNKWQKHALLQQKDQSNGDEAISNTICKICNIKECKDEEVLYRKLNEPDIVYLAVEFAPPRSSTLLDIAIDAGIPVALWPRRVSNTPNAFPDLLKTLLLQPYELPIRVKQQREGALEDKRHQGHYLTLLWDNPYRVPKDIAEGLFVAPKW